MAKFKKVDVTEEVSEFVEQTPREVDAEIIEAMKEGQAKIEELEADIERLTAGNESLKKVTMERLDLIGELEDENAGLKKQLEPKDPPKVNKRRWGFIKDLRKRDTPEVNKTCAGCTRRCSWKEMDYGKSDFCDKCLGK